MKKISTKILATLSAFMMTGYASANDLNVNISDLQAQHYTVTTVTADLNNSGYDSFGQKLILEAKGGAYGVTVTDKNGRTLRCSSIMTDSDFGYSERAILAAMSSPYNKKISFSVYSNSPAKCRNFGVKHIYGNTQ